MLPTADGGAVVADSVPVEHLAVLLDTDAAESRFVVYAWPIEVGFGSIRAFATDETGAIYAVTRSPYTGTRATPRPGAALGRGRLDTLSGRFADGMPAQDGNVWRRVD